MGSGDSVGEGANENHIQSKTGVFLLCSDFLFLSRHTIHVVKCWSVVFALLMVIIPTVSLLHTHTINIHRKKGKYIEKDTQKYAAHSKLLLSYWFLHFLTHASKKKSKGKNKSTTGV